MKRRIFYSFMIVAFVFFALISVGGCGGSSSYLGETESESEEEGTDTEPIDPTEAAKSYKFDMDKPDSEVFDEVYSSSDIAGFIYSMGVHNTENYVERTGDDTDEYEKLLARADSNDVIFLYEVPDPELLVSVASEDSTDEEADKREYAKERARIITDAFNRGASLALVYPDADKINALHELLGIESTHVFSEGAALKRKELYSLTKKSTEDVDLVFAYSIESDSNVSFDETSLDEVSADSSFNIISSDDLTVTSDDEISGDISDYIKAEASSDVSESVITLILSGDISSDADILSEDKETSGDLLAGVYSEDQFHLERLNNFLDFVENLNAEYGDYAEEAEAFKASLMTTAEDAVDLSSLNGLITILDKGFTKSNYSIFSNNDSFNVNLARKNEIRISAFSCHSFSNGYDYYLVQSETTTIPQAFADEQKTYKRMSGSDSFNVKLNYLHGFTKSFGMEAWIDMDGATIFKSLPNNINPSKTYSESMGWEIGGSVGIKGKDAEATVSGKVTHNQSISWTTREYEIKNETNGSIAKWNAVYQNPDDGGKHSDFPYVDGYYGVNAKGSSRERTSFVSEWLWVVPRESWLKNPGAPDAWVKENWQEGFCIGKCWYTSGSFPWPTYTWDRKDLAYSFSTESQKINMPVPPRIATSGGYFHPGSGGQSFDFDLYTDGDWTATADDWIHLSDSSTGGSSTGPSPKRITFQVDSNPTGKQRTGYITFKTATDTLKLEIVQAY